MPASVEELAWYWAAPASVEELAWVWAALASVEVPVWYSAVSVWYSAALASVAGQACLQAAYSHWAASAWLVPADFRPVGLHQAL